MLFCLRCKAPQTDDSAKMTKRFFDDVKIRKRILAMAATGSNKPIEALLTSDLRHMGDGQRAAKLNFSSVAERLNRIRMSSSK